MQTEIKTPIMQFDLVLEEFKKSERKRNKKDELKQAKRFYFGNILISIDSYSAKKQYITRNCPFRFGF